MISGGSINSMGIPNLGYRTYTEFLPEAPLLRKAGGGLHCGLQPGGVRAGGEHISDAGPDLVEVDLSCPNVVGRPQIAYDFEASAAILKAVRPVVRQPMGVKIPPYLDLALHEAMARVLRECRVDFLVAINSIGNALAGPFQSADYADFTAAGAYLTPGPFPRREGGWT